MQNTISREKAIKLISEIRDVVEKDMEISKYFGSDFLESNEEKIELETGIQGVSNGFLSEILCAITGYDIEVCGEVKKLFACPYCNWEDDGTTDTKIYRSINKGSIEDYRNNMQTKFNKFYIDKWLLYGFVIILYYSLCMMRGKWSSETIFTVNL